VAVREPTHQQSIRSPIERRTKRLTMQPCAFCGSAHTHVATRTEFFVYFRCKDCAFVWSTAKPTHA
jgi:hypothetical protein